MLGWNPFFFCELRAHAISWNPMTLENRNKVVNNFKSLSDTDGILNTNGMWKLKKKLFPKHVQSVPTAKKDSQGNLISTQEELKNYI